MMTEHHRFVDGRGLTEYLTSRRSHVAAIPEQTQRLDERRKSSTPLFREIRGLSFEIFPGVYKTGVDTELLMDFVHIEVCETFVEIGCGPGVASIFLAKRSAGGLACDVNPVAIENTRRNAEVLCCRNLVAQESDVFAGVNGYFDVVIFNPPYNNHEVTDFVDRMFWDPDDVSKAEFFNSAASHLKHGGRIYFGWASFSDLDPALPQALATKAGLLPIEIWSKRHPAKSLAFHLIHFALPATK